MTKSYLRRRGPDGKFIPYGCSVQAWLPELLGFCPFSDNIPAALEAAAANCVKKAMRAAQEQASDTSHNRYRLQLNRADRWMNKSAAIHEFLKVYRAMP